MLSPGPQPATPPEFTHSSLRENPALYSSVCSRCGKLIAVSAQDDKLAIVERAHHCT
jgi:hypothetical protein